MVQPSFKREKEGQNMIRIEKLNTYHILQQNIA